MFCPNNSEQDFVFTLKTQSNLEDLGLKQGRFCWTTLCRHFHLLFADTHLMKSWNTSWTLTIYSDLQTNFSLIFYLCLVSSLRKLTKPKWKINSWNLPCRHAVTRSEYPSPVGGDLTNEDYRLLYMLQSRYGITIENYAWMQWHQRHLAASWGTNWLSPLQRQSLLLTSCVGKQSLPWNNQSINSYLYNYVVI